MDETAVPEFANEIEERVRQYLATRGDEFEIEYEVNLEPESQTATATPVVAENPLLNKTRFNFEVPNRLHIVVAGLGGTGGYVARDIGRLIKEKEPQYETRLTFIDPDMVEEKNLTRQNFIEEDIGYSKAGTLAERYSLAYGLEIGAIEEWCTESLLSTLLAQARPNETMLIIGCIDNNKGRREIHNFINANTVRNSRVLGWIDSGNESTSGQVILGCPGNYCSHYLPFVTDYYPELLDPTQDPVEQEVSCAERAQVDIQNMFVNITAATHILNLINLIYSGNRSVIHGIEFSIRGVNQSKFLEMNRTKRDMRNSSEAIWHQSRRAQVVAA